MNEPIYQFVKGQGWIPTDGDIVTLSDGARVKLECREPVDQELCIWTYCADMLDLAAWTTWARTVPLTYFSTRSYWVITNRPDITWLVVTPL